MVGAQEQTLSLVPGRSCGNCVVCCYVPDIDSPELKKPPGVVCANCTGKACAIYETRPHICREFYCGWWYSPELGDNWRPDRSGVLMTLKKSRIPDSYSIREGWQFTVFGGEIAIHRVGFVEKVLGLIERRVPVFMSAAGPMGAPMGTCFLNDVLADVAGKHDQPGALSMLISLYRRMLELDSVAKQDRVNIADRRELDADGTA
jgi:hypothetical protein